MGFFDRGMKLTARGLRVAGEQIIKIDNMYVPGTVVVLDDGNITSYKYNPTSDTGFSETQFASNIKSYVDGIDVVAGRSIMEIAGGTSMKIRYDNGVCITVMINGDNSFLHSIRYNVARITKNNVYTINTGEDKNNPIPYYKSGSGTAQLVPLLSDGTNNDIVAVFEGEQEDYIVRMEDVTVDPIVGYVGNNAIVGDGENNSIVTPDGEIAIDGFGTIYRNSSAVTEIFKSHHIETDSSAVVDYSNIFSPVHYTYIQANREDWTADWAGYGGTGYVVDAGDTAYMRVQCDIPTAELDDNIPFVIIDGDIKKVNSDGSLVPLQAVDYDGAELIKHIYGNDMSQTLVIGSGLAEVEPFAVNGYSFGYGPGRWEDAALPYL